jgi:hypothetical protein
MKIRSFAAGLIIISLFPSWTTTGVARDALPFAVNLASIDRPWEPSALPHIEVGRDHRLYETRFVRDGRTWYRLRLGLFSTRQAAVAAKQAVSGQFPDAWVTRISAGEWDNHASLIEPSRNARPQTEAPTPVPGRQLPSATPPGEPAGEGRVATPARAAQSAQRRPAVAPRQHETGPARSTKSAVSHDVDGRLEGGYDSNPLKLNSNVSGAVLGRVKLGYKMTYRFAQRQRLFGGGELNARRYDIDEADRDNGKIEVGFRDSSLKLGDTRLRTTVGARYGFRTMTFVDQATGQEETSSGTAIGTRFDADWFEPFAAFRAGVTDATTLTLDGSAKFQDYRDDFANLGLDRLDYNEYALEPGLRQALGGGLSMRIKLPVSVRVYDDRRAEDLSGNDIAGSDLRYFYYGIDASIGDQTSQSMRWTIGADGERRQDNESGFNDKTTYGLYTRVTFGRRDGNRFSVNVKASRREFDELDISAVDETNDGGRVKQGVRASLSYTNPIALTSDIDVDLFVRGGAEAFDNSDANFEYARYSVSAGLRKKF